VRLANGQRVFVCSVDCAERLRGDFRKFVALPGERYIETPDMLHQHLICPECKASSGGLKVTETTPRLMLRHGQCVFFNSFQCLASFIKSPSFMSSSISTMMLGEARSAVGGGIGLTATCPVTAKKFNVDDKAHVVQFKNGQRLFTCGASCPIQLMRNIQGYIRLPSEPFAHPPHPSVSGLMQMCVHCSHAFVIDEEQTPRVQFKGGQCIYFHTNSCADEFYAAPHKFLIPLTTETVIQPAPIVVPGEAIPVASKASPSTVTGSEELDRAELERTKVGTTTSQVQPTASPATTATTRKTVTK